MININKVRRIGRAAKVSVALLAVGGPATPAHASTWCEMLGGAAAGACDVLAIGAGGLCAFGCTYTGPFAGYCVSLCGAGAVAGVVACQDFGHYVWEQCDLE
jgi:hypothetical protein